MTESATRIDRIHVVMVPSADQDKSVEFYEKMGFEKRLDVPYGGDHRWVEMFPPGGTGGIALMPRRPEDSKGVETGIILTTDDIDTTHAQLRANDVDVDDQVARPGAERVIRIGAAEVIGPVPAMFWFRDPDGNALLVVAPE